MTNYFMAIGRIAKIEKKEMEIGGKKIIATIAIPRTFKNIDGCYDTDFINCSLYGVVGSNTLEWCRKGDIIAIKGRIQTNNNTIELIGEKVTFLTSRKAEDGE